MPNGGKALAGCSPSQPSPSRGRGNTERRFPNPLTNFKLPQAGQVEIQTRTHGTRAPKGNVKKYEVTYPLKSFIIN